MAIPRSFLYYRIERVPHPVAVRMVDPSGVQIEHMCCALTKLEQTAKSREAGRRDVHAIARLLSSTKDLIEDPVVHMLGDWKGFRETFSAGLSALKVHSEDRGGIIWVKPSVDAYPVVKTAAAAFGRLGSILADRVYDGIDPSARLAVPVRDKYDVGNLFRVVAPERGAPRVEDPRFWKRWLAGLKATGADKALILAGYIARFGGPRAFQILEATVWDAFVSPKQPNTVMLGNKGASSNHNLPVRLPEFVWKMLGDFIRNERFKRTGFSIEDLEAMARDADARKLLRAMPLLTECGERPISYGRLYRVYRTAAEYADLFFEDQRFLELGERRYVTFHFLRHEFVHERMDRILERPANARSVEYQKLRDQMGWSRFSSMLDWYSRHHQIKVGALGAAEHAEYLDIAHGEDEGEDNYWNWS